VTSIICVCKDVANIFSKAELGDDSSGITSRTVDYNNKSSLAEALRGIHTVLSFIQLLADPENTAQKNLIDASVAAGVKRFAPSEWGRYVQNNAYCIIASNVY